MIAKITIGKQMRPMIHMIYGLPGVGKTTWASSFPDPLIIDLEKGSYHLDVARIDDVANYDALMQTLQAIASGVEETKKFRTIVIDSIEAMEALMCDHICIEGNVASIEKYDGGFGKGYARLRELARGVMTVLRKITETRGATVILIGHSQQKQFSDPSENTTFDRYTMRVNDKMGSVIRDLSDNVFFACHKVYTTKENGKTKAFSEGERVMKTEWRAAFDAKNRMSLPFELPLSYDAFMKASLGEGKSVDELRIDAEELAKAVKEEPIRTAALEKIKTSTTKEELLSIKARLYEIVKN